MKIAIVGVGKMGSWLAKELAKENEVAVYDKDSSKCEGIGGVTVLSGLSELESFGAQIVVNAVPLQSTVSAFEEIVKYAPTECILSDMASIKGDLAEYYSSCGFRFVSVHPMFGPTFANVESLSKENTVIIKESDAEGAEFFRKFFGKLGLNLFEYTFVGHDQMMAYSLGLPFISTMVFAACMDDNAVPGTTFARQKKLAQGLLSEEDQLLAEILFNPHALTQLEKVTSRLEFMKHIIKGRDMDEAKRFFNGLRKNIG